MKKILFLFLFILAINSCKKDEGDIVSPGNEYTPKIITETYGTAKLVGFVKDKAGNPLAGVTVFFGEEKALTGSDGGYQLNTLSAGSNKRIWFQKSGYASTQKLAEIREELPNRIDASLFPIDKTEKMNSDGGKIEGKDFSVEIKSGGFVFSDGGPVEEDVFVEVTAFLTSEDEFLDAFPGEFRGTRENGTETAIESFGFIDVVLKVKSGEPVQLADGVTAIIKIKAPQNSPATIPMWHYDEDKAKWIEEGIGKLDNGLYTAEVSHFTKWNWDRPIELISKIVGRVVDNSGNPIEGASLIQTGKNRSFQLTTKSIDDGTFEIFTLENFRAEIEAFFDIYGSTIINYTTSPNMGQVNNIGDIKINVSIDNVVAPIVSNKILYITIGQTEIIKGKNFGEQKRVGYKLLLNGNEVETTAWQNDLIEFVVPNGIPEEGTIQIDRDGILSRIVNYKEGDWTCEIDGILYDNNNLQTDGGRYRLYLWRESIKNLPNCIENLQNLEGIFLNDNDLTTLPESFGNLQNLEELYIDHNKLISLPESFGNLQNLEELYIDNNKIISLPESFGNLKSLRDLDLKSNELASLPENFGNLQNLEVLSLIDNPLSSLPESFGNLKNLLELRLYSDPLMRLNSNPLSSLPESFGNLSNLQILVLGFNNLSSLPESFSNLQNLEKLYIDNNKINSLSESFGDLRNLEYLYLNNNKLSTLPESIGNLKNLRNLELGFNNLSSLPESFSNLQELKRLYIYRNQFSILPESIGYFSNLTFFVLDSNQLISLPESIGNLKNLNTLRLNNNKLNTLPVSIGNLKNLRYLELEFNNLSSLPESIKNLKENLKSLRLEGNYFSAEEKVKVEGWLPNTTIHWY